MHKKRVMFVCSHNSARSQMAEAFLRAYGGEAFEAHSAGLAPEAIHPLVRQVMAEVGIDMSEGYRSKSLVDDYLDRGVGMDYLVTVSSSAARSCPAYPGLAAREDWDIANPSTAQSSEAERLAKFREVRDQIAAEVKAFIARARRAAEKQREADL